MKYFGGCDVGSTYTKCVILDENGKIVAHVTNRSKINPVASAEIALNDAVAKVDGINSAEELTYLIGTGYGRNKVPFADENISEISCHAMGVHVTNPEVKAIIDIGGQDTKIISVRDGMVQDFLMNDKCSAGTGRFLEVMANTLALRPDELCDLARQGGGTAISSMCTVFAESEVISLIGRGEKRENIAFAVVDSVVQKVASQAGKLTGTAETICLTGGLCQCEYIREVLSRALGSPVVTCADGRYAGAVGAALSGLKL